MGKKRQRVRWSTVDGLKWAGNGEEDSGSEGSSVAGSQTTATTAVHHPKQQLKSTAEHAPVPQQLLAAPMPLAATGGGGYEYHGGRGGGYHQQPHWGHQHQQYNGGWGGNEVVAPRFEKRTQVRSRHNHHQYGDDGDGVSDAEEMPNGFTKIRSKNLDILFKKEYYQQKLRPKERADMIGGDPSLSPAAILQPCAAVPAAMLAAPPPHLGQEQQLTAPVAATDQADSTTSKKPKVSTGNSFENIDVSEIPEFKPASALVSASSSSQQDTPPADVDPAYYTTAAAPAASYYQPTAVVTSATGNNATGTPATAENTSQAAAASSYSPAATAGNTGGYPAPPPEPVRPNLYLYSPADNTLIQCKGVILTNPVDQGSYYYLAYPVTTSADGSPQPPMAGYVAQAVGPGGGPMVGGAQQPGGGEAYSECGASSVPYYSSPSCMSQCHSSTPQTPNSSGTSTQPASPPLLQSYHPTNWFPRETQEDIDEEEVVACNPTISCNQANNISNTSPKDQEIVEGPTVQYIPGLPIMPETTSKKKKKKKKKTTVSVPQQQLMEHRDSLSSDPDQLLVSTIRQQGESTTPATDDLRTVSSPAGSSPEDIPSSPPSEPVVEVFLTDDLADSMVNPPTDPECSDEETLKNTTTNNNIPSIAETLEDNNSSSEMVNGLPRDDTYSNLNDDFQDYLTTSSTAGDIIIKKEGSSETNEHLTDSGIEDNICNTSSDNIQEEGHKSMPENEQTESKPAVVEKVEEEECKDEIKAGDNVDDTSCEKTIDSVKAVEDEPRDLMAVDITNSSDASEQKTEAGDDSIKPETTNVESANNNATDEILSMKENNEVKDAVINEISKPASKSSKQQKRSESKKRNKRQLANSSRDKPATVQSEAAQNKSEEPQPAAISEPTEAANNSELLSRMSYSAALRLRDNSTTTTTSKQESKSSDLHNSEEPTLKNTHLEADKKAANPRQNSSPNRQTSSKPHGKGTSTSKSSSSSISKASSSMASKKSAPAQETLMKQSAGWETVPPSLASVPGEWEKKEKKRRKKNKKIVFEDSHKEEDQDQSPLDAELPSLETVSLPPTSTKTAPTSSNTQQPKKEASIERLEEQQESSNKKKGDAAATNTNTDNKKDATPEDSTESSEEEKRKMKKKKKKTSSAEVEDNAHKVLICDNQIEVRFSRCVRRATDVLDSERLEAVKTSGYCDVLLVEKLGFGIYRGSMHLGRLHQGKYVPPDRSDADIPPPEEGEGEDVDEDDQEEVPDLEEVNINVLPEEVFNNNMSSSFNNTACRMLPTVAEEIDLD